MNVVFYGVLLWGLVLGVAAACFRVLKPACRLSFVHRVLWGICLLGAVAFLMRPEEELSAGEDPAAYFNMAIRFASHGKFFFEDAGLTAIPESQRLLFRYGHHGFGMTKDACFWIDDLAAARVGPWFQPAYPLLLSVPVAVGFQYAALLVTPFLAILAAWLLSGIVRRIFENETMALGAFVLFLLHPVMAWNARCLRPEMAAAYFVLAGVTLLTIAPARCQMKGWRGLLSGLSLSVAVLFHVTAVYIVLPAMLMAAWRTRRQRFWIGWWAGLTAGFVLLAAQTVWVTDPYNLAISWNLPERRRWMLTAMLALFAGLAVLTVRRSLCRAVAPLVTRVAANLNAAARLNVLCRIWRRFRQSAALRGGMPAAMYILGVSWIFLARDPLGNIPGLPRWVTGYLSLTDFRGVVHLSSRAWSLMALAGVLCLCVRRGQGGIIGRRIFYLLAPATLTIGWMFNYMFETRRAMTALIPLLILATMAAIHALYTAINLMRARICRHSLNSVLQRYAGFVAPAIICGVAIIMANTVYQGRETLYRLWNRRGAYGVYKAVADRVAREGDFLFAEYTQMAAPVGYLSSLPLLPIAWGYRSEVEYRRAEEAIAAMVREHPGRRHLLITPFSGAALPGMAVERFFEEHVETRVLGRERMRIPTTIYDYRLGVQVFRLLHPEHGIADRGYTRIMDGSRLGLDGAANFMSGQRIEVEGVAVDAGRTVSINVEPPYDSPLAYRRVALVVAIPSKSVPEILTVEPDDAIKRVQRGTLCPGWEIIELLLDPSVAWPGALRLSASETIYLTDVLSFSTDGKPACSWRIDNQKTRVALHDVQSQWVRAASAVALPAPADRSHVWLYATREYGAEAAMTLSMRADGRDDAPPTLAIEPEWGWHVLPLRASGADAGVFEWADIRVTPPLDTGLPGFPDDLGIRIHALVVRVDEY